MRLRIFQYIRKEVEKETNNHNLLQSGFFGLPARKQGFKKSRNQGSNQSSKLLR